MSLGDKKGYVECGMFTEQWRNPPPPFNPAFDPKAAARYAQVTASLEADGYYDTHTREECRAEWAARYEHEKQESN